MLQVRQLCALCDKTWTMHSSSPYDLFTLCPYFHVLMHSLTHMVMLLFTQCLLFVCLFVFGVFFLILTLWLAVTTKPKNQMTWIFFKHFRFSEIHFGSFA